MQTLDFWNLEWYGDWGQVKSCLQAPAEPMLLVNRFDGIQRGQCLKRQFGFVKVRYWGLKKHVATQDAICAVQPMIGPAPIDGNARISASENSAIALDSAKKAQMLSTNRL